MSSPGLVQKFKNRVNAVKFEFSIHLHTLQPWPASTRGIAIGWQRGQRRRGATSSVAPLQSKSGSSTVVRFNERFNLSSSLYRVPGADRNSQAGPFKKKILILAVLETDPRTNATNALGRIVIDLAEFASIQGQELRTFAVACNKSIHAAVGEPQLTLTIRCHWKKAGVDMTEDEVASMSTDTTGSNLANNIRGLFRGRGGRTGAKREEQDLLGFAKGDANMATIGEEDDGSARSRGADLGDLRGFTEAEEVEFDSLHGSNDGSAWGAAALEYDAGALHLHDEDDEPRHKATDAVVTAAAAQSVSAQQQRERERTDAYLTAAQARRGSTAVAPAGPEDELPAPVAQQQQQQQPESIRSRLRWPWMKAKDKDNDKDNKSAAKAGVISVTAARAAAPSNAGLPRVQLRKSSRASHTMSAQTELGDLAPPEPQLDDVSALQAWPTLLVNILTADELLMAAGIEFAVYNAQRPLLPTRTSTRCVHTPARRIARTLVCLGRQDGLAFGQLALRQVSACVLAGRSDTRLLAFWWTNAVHLRGFLQSLSLAMAQATGETGTNDEAPKHWAAEVLVPALLNQEKFVFDELVSYVWTHTFVPAVAASRARPPSAAVAAGVVKRAAQEAALRKWLAALEAVLAHLSGLGRYGHIPTLRHQVLLEVMKRMDALILHTLIHAPPPGAGHDAASEASSSGLGGGGATSPSHGSSSRDVLRDPLNPHLPLLDDSMIFFTRGCLTFGAGMNIKMAATRFQQWAFAEGGMREIWANLPSQGQSLFPLLRTAADLLMMPKELLLEAGIREDLIASLPVPVLLYMLEHFAPDDFSREGIPHGVLAALRREAGATVLRRGGPPPPLVVEGECTYYSPTDDMAMEKVEIGEEPGLEYDADSEDELNALGGLAADLGGPPPLRYKLLHNLWSAGVPRNRRITILRDDAADEGGTPMQMMPL